MSSKIKGEVHFKIGGKDYPCTLSIGALAELADVLGIETFDAMGMRIAQIGPRDIPKVLTAILHGNGHSVDAADIKRLNVEEVMIPFQALMSSGAAKEDKPSPRKAAA